MSSNPDEELCAICQQTLSAQSKCITDCGHVFCLECTCRHLPRMKNKCSICRHKVKRVLELLSHENTSIQPAYVKYCNATYELYVSIWSVQDPVKVLTELFALEKARIIHKGKLLNNGHVWPGSVVQVFGTAKGEGENQPPSQLVEKIKEFASPIQTAVLLFLSIMYGFFHSIIKGEKYKRPKQSYERVESSPTAQGDEREPFLSPGAAREPDENRFVD